MEILKNIAIEKTDVILKRPGLANDHLEDAVKTIIASVRASGDTALRELTAQLDGVELHRLKVSADELGSASEKISESLRAAIDRATKNIETFHAAQKREVLKVDTMPGVSCWRKSVPIQKVGLYIPGGTAPLFSTVLMLGVPARLAGCKQIVLCTPPDKSGSVHPAILHTAQSIGITEIFKVGGAQAIAALASGTESVPKTDKIFGPGNQYVTKAKQLVNMEGVAIDMPAGPSEVAIIADASAPPEFVAADLLSQAEHGADSQVILISDSEVLVNRVVGEMNRQLQALPRKETAAQCLKNSRAVICRSMDEAMEISNRYAPEHLIINCEEALALADKVTQAGSVFIGPYTPESAGDYASGTNHTLPTNGAARAYSGVSLDSFVKEITFQQITDEGLRNLGPVVEEMAEAEQLMAHKNAVSVRLERAKK